MDNSTQKAGQLLTPYLSRNLNQSSQIQSRSITSGTHKPKQSQKSLFQKKDLLKQFLSKRETKLGEEDQFAASLRRKNASTKKQPWDDNTKTVGVFDPQLSKNIIAKEKISTQKSKQEEQNLNENPKLTTQDKRKETNTEGLLRAAKNQQEKMERERKAYQSYHNIQQIQHLMDQQQSKKTAQLLSKQQNTLSELRWMIENDKNQNQSENQQVYQERFDKLLEQEELNLKLKDKMIKIQEHKNDLLYNKLSKQEQQFQITKVQGRKDQDNKPAEYIEGMIDQNDENLQKLLKDAEADIQQQEDDGDNQKNEKGKTYKFLSEQQKKQKQYYENITKQLNDLQREQQKKMLKVDQLLFAHQRQLEKEKMLENQHVLSVEDKLQQIQDLADPLEKEITKRYNIDLYRGNFLAKASAKLIQTNSDRLTEMLINDLLLETVGMLEKLENRQKEIKKKQKVQSVLSDYIEEFKFLAKEEEEVENRLADKPDFYNFYKAPNGKQRKYFMEREIVKVLKIELNKSQADKIEKYKDEFKKYCVKKSYYSQKNLDYFKIITEALIDEIIVDSTHDMEKISSEYAELLFKSEFQ